MWFIAIISLGQLLKHDKCYKKIYKFLVLF